MIDRHLKKGELWIGVLGEYYLKATFLGVGHRGMGEYSIESQKGVSHLLDALDAQISGDNDLQEKVEKKYVYLLSWQAITPIDRLLQQTFSHIYEQNHAVVVDCYQILLPGKKALPGLFKRCGSGETVMAALVSASVTSAISRTTYVPGMPEQKQ